MEIKLNTVKGPNVKIVSLDTVICSSSIRRAGEQPERDQRHSSTKENVLILPRREGKPLKRG